MKDIVLSVIIPHYNDLNRLRRCIESIPKKDDIEIIVVDDGSDEEIKTQIPKNNILFFENKSGEHSAGTCRNIGLDHARGKWIMFSDCDDYYLPSMYDAVSKYFESDYDLVVFKGTSIDEETGKESYRHLGFCRAVDAFIECPGRKQELELRTLCEPWLKLIRKSLIDRENIRFDNIYRSNDVMFSTKVGLKAETVGADNTCINCISNTISSLSKTSGKSSYSLMKRVLVHRHIYLFQNLSKEECLMMGMRWNALKLVMTPFRYRIGIKCGIEFYRLFRKNKVPLIII